MHWEFASDSGDNGTVAGDTLYAVSDDSNIYAIDAATGNELWRVATGGPINTGATFAGDIVSPPATTRTSTPSTPPAEPNCGTSRSGRAEHGPAVADGVAYLGTDSGTIIAITGNDRTSTDTTN